MITTRKELILAHIRLTGIDPSKDLLDGISLPISNEELKKLLKDYSSNSLRLKFIELGGEKGFLEEKDFQTTNDKIMFRNLASSDRMMFKEFKSLLS